MESALRALWKSEPEAEELSRTISSGRLAGGELSKMSYMDLSPAWKALDLRSLDLRSLWIFDGSTPKNSAIYLISP